MKTSDEAIVAVGVLRRAMTAEYVINTGASPTSGRIPGIKTVEQANEAAERAIRKAATMISDKAVEAAAKALHDLGVYAKAWDERDGELRELYREGARAALASAAPYMLAPVWFEGYREGELDGALQRNGHEPPGQRNPYRSEA
jgi:hypothetical protein